MTDRGLEYKGDPDNRILFTHGIFNHFLSVGLATIHTDNDEEYISVEFEDIIRRKHTISCGYFEDFAEMCFMHEIAGKKRYLDEFEARMFVINAIEYHLESGWSPY